MESKKEISLVLVEDDDEIRQLLQFIIDRTNGFSCLATFKDCESAIISLPTLKPDVVLMDIELPGITGIEGVKLLKEKLPETDFIMLTIKDDDDSVFESLKSGASGYILKDTPPAKLLEAIIEAYEGGSPITRSIARKITESFHPKYDSILSEREKEILNDLCDGMGYRPIAEKRFISGHTVRSHIKNIYQKLHVNSRAQAVQKAIKDHLI